MPVLANDEFTSIARIVRPQGRRGEVLAEILTDFPERFSQRKRLWLSSPSASPRECELESHWLHKGRVVLKFAGVESIADAELLNGLLVQIPIQERATLENGAIYVSDLVGCTVLDGGTEVGVIDDVRQDVGVAPMLLVRGARGEHEIPFAEAYVVRFDPKQKRLEMNLPPGLLAINAPLSEKEKEQT